MARCSAQRQMRTAEKVQEYSSSYMRPLRKKCVSGLWCHRKGHLYLPIDQRKRISHALHQRKVVPDDAPYWQHRKRYPIVGHQKYLVIAVYRAAQQSAEVRRSRIAASCANPLVVQNDLAHLWMYIDDGVELRIVYIRDGVAESVRGLRIGRGSAA